METKKKWIMIIVCSVLALVLISIISVFFVIPSIEKKMAPSYTVNKEGKATNLKVDNNFSLFSGNNIGYSFLYPTYRETFHSESDGTYIYCGDEKSAPYVLICKTNKKGIYPEKYFKSCNKIMTDMFTNVHSTKIQEVTVGEKVLYMVRYVCGEKIIDRYVELYKNFYIEYTGISQEKDSLNTEMYYAIKTLQVNENAYVGAFSKSVTEYKQDELNLIIDIPDMLKTNELTIGYFSTCNDAILLAVLINKDDDGKEIYNRQDFIDRAAQSPSFVAGLLGADETDFSNGQEHNYGGKSFYCYPMEMRLEEDRYVGELNIADADESGCWIVCYAVRENCSIFSDMTSLMKKSAESITIE